MTTVQGRPSGAPARTDGTGAVRPSCRHQAARPWQTQGFRRPRQSGTGEAQPSSASRFPALTTLHTLGPAGTNCELAAQAWFAREGQPATVVLHASLEAAASAAAAMAGSALLVPVAYPALHTLVYAHLGTLELVDSVIVDTHAMVLARRPGTPPTPVTVATHPAPVQLVPSSCTVRDAASTSQAAADCAAGLADACVTTLPAMQAHGLELVRDFGPVAMAFTVHVRR